MEVNIDYLSSKIELALAEKETSTNYKFYLKKVCDAEKDFLSSVDEKTKKEFEKYSSVVDLFQDMLVEEAIEFTVDICRKIFTNN